MKSFLKLIPGFLSLLALLAFTDYASATYTLDTLVNTGRHPPLQAKVKLQPGQAANLETESLHLRLQAENYGKNRVLITGELQEKTGGKMRLLARPMLISKLGERSVIQITDPQNKLELSMNMLATADPVAPAKNLLQLQKK